MGGNNVGFPSVLADCIAIAGAGGYGCAKRDDGPLQAAIGWLANGRPVGCYALPGVDPAGGAEQICSNKPVPSLHQAYEEIGRRLASGGTVAVVGYPKLFGTSFQFDRYNIPGGRQSCYVGDTLLGSAFIGSADVQWINAQANNLNTTIAHEAARAQTDLTAAGVHVTVKFIPVDNGSKSVFAGHHICDTGTPYFHALETFDFGTKAQQWSFHPNDAGITAYGNAITAQL
jgi:hypothetical protein